MASSDYLRKGLKTLALLLVVVVSLILGIVSIAYLRQDSLVQGIVSRLNNEFKGRIELQDSHISPFKLFPYVAVDLEKVKVYEGKQADSEVILEIEDAYIGFDLLSLAKQQYDIHSIELNGGFLKLVQHADGTFNIMQALASNKSQNAIDTVDESLHLDLRRLSLHDIDLTKLNEANNVLIETFINDLESSYKNVEENIAATLSGDFIFNLVVDGDTSFLHNKHFELSTGLGYNAAENKLTIAPSQLLIEKGQFLMEGSIDIRNDMNLDLHFAGRKPNFDLFLAFVPEELSPLLSRYENGGEIYFEASVKGPSMNGLRPQVEVDFGASQAYVRNSLANKAVDDLNFRGHFSNGAKRNASTMSLVIEDFTAKPETGEFIGSISVRDFSSPDIEMRLLSRFDLDFLAGFLNLTNLVDVSGDVSLELNFHDIIDLSNPEKSIEKLNESYFTRLEVKNLSFRDTGYKLPIRDVNILAVMDGHEASIEQFAFKLGKSDLSIKATVSDLPAILHHTSTPVNVAMSVKSALLDLEEITGSGNDSVAAIREQLSDLALELSFISSAKAFTESPYLPVGEFFIDDLQATFAHYPHRLHDFHADVLIDQNNFKVIDFTGFIDQSDFHFNGTLNNYGIWFAEVPKGSTGIDFSLNSRLLQLADIFSYGGENYVPEDYRQEELRNFTLHGLATLNFDSTLVSTAITIDKLAANLRVHPMRFENFSGHFYLDGRQFEVSKFGGKLGNSRFTTDLTYHFGNDSTKQHLFSLQAERLDFDQLFAFNPLPVETTAPVDHDAGFNIFTLPFPRLEVQLAIDQLNYHRYAIDNFNMKARMRPDHFVFLDTLNFRAAGGSFAMKGYFNGSDPGNIYFSPQVNVNKVNLDQLMFKFENFGQDQLVSDNLHGALSGEITGKVHMHADLIPSIEDSNLHINFMVTDGSINNFPPFLAMSDYFADKNLANVRFDTLHNDLYLNSGTLRIPTMNINSTLGYFELSGEQNINLDMAYTMRIPVKVVSKAAFQKLFGRKNSDNSQNTDEIQYRDETKQTRFVNININGRPDNYTISLGKN